MNEKTQTQAYLAFGEKLQSLEGAYDQALATLKEARDAYRRSYESLTGVDRDQNAASFAKSELVKVKAAGDLLQNIQHLVSERDVLLQNNDAAMTEAEPRNWVEDARRRNYVEIMSKYLRVPGSAATLSTVQAASLVEMGMRGGLFGPQSVAAGRGLTSILSVIVGRCNRPLMILPANLQAKMRQDMQGWGRSWVIPGNVMSISFEMLAHTSHSRDLEMFQPDHIVVPD